MPAQDTTETKEKIISIIKRDGPRFPAQVSREIGLSILFTSAFLSELVSDKRLKISNIKVGSSPLYFIPGQEPLLEKFSSHLKDKEKEAFELLKQKKVLEDIKQVPAIRIALRQMKDFAIPFKKDDKIYWKFFSIPKEEIQIKESKPEPKIEAKEKTLNIFDKEEKPKRKTPLKRKTSARENKFLEKIKRFLSENSIELLDIESLGKDELILRVRDKGEEKILVGYNKKRLNENDIIKAAKKASSSNLPYVVACLGEPLKKTTDLINALENLSSIQKIK